MQPDDGRVVSSFIVQALKSDALTVDGDGDQTRSFCYVEDLLDGLVKMMESSADVTGPINLGSPHEITIRDLAKTVIRLSGSSVPIVCTPRPEDDPSIRRPDISRAHQILDWFPRIALEEGLSRTIAWFRSTL